MKVNILTPYSLEKNLGKAYNEAMAMIGDDDWACLIDHDVLFLTPDAGRILHEYAVRFPACGMLTCYTNRIHHSSPQLLNSQIADETDMLLHLDLAERRKFRLYDTTELHKNVSGFLMLISKKVWKQVPFADNGQCLGVDTDYWKRLKAAGLPILRMDGLYVFHLYRMGKPITDKTHLY